MTYQLVLDVWEGQLEVNEAAWLAGNVAGAIVRLNDTQGGHHMDVGFSKQWSDLSGTTILRAPYFVYNPWVSGKANYDWLVANCPSTPIVFIDIEVRYSGYTAAMYASNVAQFMGLAKLRWRKVVVYTGLWFLPNLTYWPTNVDYWWAAYPNVLYPAGAETWTWTKLWTVLNSLQWTNVQSPGPVRLKQVSGDRLILPGSTKVMDVSIFQGDLDQLKTWWGAAANSTEPTDDEKLELLWQDYLVRRGA